MSAVITTTNGHVRTIRLNRPEVKNAINDELAWGVIGGIEEAARDDSVWVICVTGTNDAFCSGLDLRGAGESHNPQSAQTKYLDEFGWVSRFLLTTGTECDKPVVAGINGGEIHARRMAVRGR